MMMMMMMAMILMRCSVVPASLARGSRSSLLSSRLLAPEFARQGSRHLRFEEKSVPKPQKYVK